MPYGQALALQRSVARARIDGSIEHDVLLLVEHPPVVTVGRSSKDAHLIASPALLAARGVEHYEVDRGGDVTFHGPGQLVGYPIIDLKRHKQDLHWYLRQVEEALILTLRSFGIDGWRSPGYTGVWVGQEGVAAGVGKIASIGVHARDWVTWHGFALNVTTDLSYFDLMVPCGIDGVRMTSIANELRHVPASAASNDALLRNATEHVARAFSEVFRLELVPTRVEELRRRAVEA